MVQKKNADICHGRPFAALKKLLWEFSLVVTLQSLAFFLAMKSLQGLGGCFEGGQQK